MHITPNGIVFIVCAAVLGIWSYWLTKQVLNRQQQGQPYGKSTTFFYFLLIFSMNSLFFPFSYWIGKTVYDLSTKPTYSALITGYNSEWVDTESTDSSGNKRRYKQLMHTAQLAFTDQQNNQVNIPNSVQSTSVPSVGDHLTVVYAQGDTQAQEKSLRSILLLCAAGFMLFLLGFALLATTAYGLNKNMQSFIRLSGILVAKVIVPVAVLAMFALLSYIPFQYLALSNPMHTQKWAMLVCLFFAMMMLPLIYNLILGFLGRNNAP